MIRVPIVRMIRQPPLNVPSAIARRRRDHHPDRDVEGVRSDVTVGDQRERDQAHRLLRVVGAMRQREQPAGGELTEPETAVDRTRSQTADDPVDAQDRDAGDQEGHQRSDDRRHDQLGEQPVAQDRRGAVGCPHGTDQARRSAHGTSSTAAPSTR